MQINLFLVINLQIFSVNQLKNIFLILYSLFFLDGGSIENVSINKSSEKFTFKVAQKFSHFSLNNFVEDTSSNEDFDLEEDTDDTEDDFLETSFSKNAQIFRKPHSTYFLLYSFSHQSVKRFILYCSLKLHC